MNSKNDSVLQQTKGYKMMEKQKSNILRPRKAASIVGLVAGLMAFGGSLALVLTDKNKQDRVDNPEQIVTNSSVTEGDTIIMCALFFAPLSMLVGLLSAAGCDKIEDAIEKKKREKNSMYQQIGKQR